MAREFDSFAREKGIKLVVDIKDGSCSVTADREKMAQVIGNLIDNAIKYTPRGSVEISVGCKADDNVALLAVRDTGIGLSKNDTKKLFQKFSRSKNAYDVNVTGIGLGLYVARRIVKAHRARLWAESHGRGKGTIFFLEIPIEG